MCSFFVCFVQSHRELQKAMRVFVDETIYPDGQVCLGFFLGSGLGDAYYLCVQAREADGKKPSQDVIDKMAYV